ncbi:MAG: adenylate kinase [Saccharofermentanales bacterium]|jgi:adenylate kinase
MIKRVIMLGAPGSGKGTWSKRLADAYKLPHVSTGDLFRREAASDSALGRELRSYMDAGMLVPDDVTIQIVEQALVHGIGRDGFILDGFPRTIPQAEALDEMMDKNGWAIDIVVLLEIDPEILVDRAVARRVCQSCGQPYNVKLFPPKEDGVCDLCGGDVIQRSDDNETTVMRRYATYETKTAPLIDYYRDRGLVATFENNGPPDEAAERRFFAAIDEQIDA